MNTMSWVIRLKLWKWLWASVRNRFHTWIDMSESKPWH